MATSLNSKRRSSGWIIALQVFTVAVILVVLLPVLYLVVRAVGGGQDSLDYLLRERTVRIIINSVVLVITVTAGAALVGVPFAWLTARSDLRWRGLWLVLGLIPMVIPSYLSAITYVEAFGPKGVLQGILAVAGVERLPDIRNLFGAWLCLVMITYPYVALPVRAALLRMDPALEEAARSMGVSRWRLFWRVTLPQLRPALAGGALLAALYALSDFGAVAVMRYNAFTRAIYFQYESSFNRERAAVLALVLVAFTLVLIYLERRVATVQHNYRVGTGAGRQLRTVRLDSWQGPALIFCMVLVLIGAVVPAGVLLSWLTGRVMVNPVPVSMYDLSWDTFSISALAAVVITLVAVPLAILAHRSTSGRSRWLVSLTYAGNVLPGIVIALALIFFSAHYLPVWHRTLPLLIVGYMTRFLPFSLNATRGALTQINPHLEEAARSLGLRPWRVLWRITLPLARAGILAGAALVFLNVMKELPTTLLLGPLGTRTFATRIWSVYNEAMLVLVGRPGLLLMGISALGLVLILWREQQVQTPEAGRQGSWRERIARMRRHVQAAIAVMLHL